MPSDSKLLTLSPGGGQNKSMTTELTITGMTCGHCETAVRNALKAVPGVQDVKVDLKGGSAIVEGAADPQALVAAVTDEGYGAQPRA